MINPNDPAFPTQLYNEISGKPNGFREGLSIRAELAARAMQGLLAAWGQHDVTDFKDIASDAVMCADALILELNKPQP